MSSITLETAEQILAGCKKKIVQLGRKMSVVVTDGRGDPVAMFRNDGASWRTPDIARGKAVAAACMGVRSGDLADRANNAIFLPFSMMQGGNFIMGQGAVPVYHNGELVGAVGASGGTPEEDEVVAEMGVVTAGLSCDG